MGHQGIVRFLDDEDEFIVTEAARAINDDFSIEKALPQLGNLLLKTSFSNEALIRRSINANLRVGTPEGLQNLIGYSQKEGAPLALRTEALEAIGTWAKPSVLDRVDGRYRGEVNRDINMVKAAASAPLIQLLSSSDSEIRLLAVKDLGKLSIEEAAPQLLRVMKGDNNSEVRVAALKSLSLLPGEMDGIIKLALADRDKNLRVAGLDLLKQLNIEQDLVVELLAEVIRNRTMEEKQAAVLSLGTISSSYSNALMEELLDQLENGTLPPEIHLELIEAIENSGSSNLSGRLKAYNKGLSPDSLSASYSGSLYGGDESLGSRIFFKNQSAQCIRCHSYDDMGGSAGPPLNGIASRLSRQELLEALIEPSKRIAPGFGTVILKLDNGQVISGILESETEESITLKMGNRPDTVVLKNNVEKRDNAISSMPDMKNLLTRGEIRNLVSFLATLKEEEEE
jgi:putative heme-binding domain-containing protein